MIFSKKSFGSLFNSDAFQKNASIVTKVLSKHFDRSASEPKTRSKWIDPLELKKIAKDALHSQHLFSSPSEAIESFSQLYVDTNHRLHSPHYMGHQVPPVLPTGALFDWIGATTNQAPGLYEMGPLPNVVEKVMIDEMTKKLNWNSDEADGVGMGGGSLANLTALLAARNFRYKNIWNKGVSAFSDKKPAILTSAESHYCITRAAGIMGIGAENILKAPTTEKRKIDSTKLLAFIEESEKNGFDIFCVVASACSTPTGAFDPIDEISKITREKKIWLHVDGAHGASALFSKKYSFLLKGIEHANSVTWDAHKMLYSSALSTFLLYKDKKNVSIAFQQDAPYLNDPKQMIAQEFDTISKSIECTKRPHAMSLWANWSVYGESLFEHLIDQTFDRTKEFYALLKNSDDFTPLHEPEANILCFKYSPSFKTNDPFFQKKIREKLMNDGIFYTTGTTLNGEYVLRVTLIHPDTESIHLIELLDQIRKISSFI